MCIQTDSFSDMKTWGLWEGYARNSVEHFDKGGDLHSYVNRYLAFYLYD